MQKSKLRSSTSLVVCFGLIAGQIAAQQAPEIAPETAGEPELCIGLTPDPISDIVVPDDPAAEVVFPCVDAAGNVIEDADTLALAIAGEADRVVEETDVDEPVIVEDSPVDTSVGVEVEADASGTNEDVAPATPDLTDATQAEGAETDTDVDAEITFETVPEQETAEEETAASPFAEDTAAEEDVAVEAATSEDQGAAADATAETSEESSGDTVVVSEGLPEGGDTEAVVSDDLPVIEEEETAAAAAAEDAEASDDADIEIIEVTEADVRSSSEDFETSVDGNSGAARAEAEAGDRDDGLSNFERALLLGLGAAVVGSVLNNGDEVVSNSGDRVVVERDGELVVLKDDDALLRQPGSEVRTQSFEDGSTITTVSRANGERIVTIRGAEGRVLRRTRILEDGRQIVLFDDTQRSEPVDVVDLSVIEESDAPEVQTSAANVETLRQALMSERAARIDRNFSLRQIREIKEVRDLAPQVELDTVTFATGSAAIDPGQAEALTDLGLTIAAIIADDPGQVFLIEGHTDAVGDAGYNLALSDRRAETVALALTEYFGVPPENLITQGYGETVLKIATLGAERLNRRAAVRNITELLR